MPATDGVSSSHPGFWRVFIVSATTAMSATTYGASAPEPLCLTNANVVDVRSGRIFPHAVLVLRDGKIESVGAGVAPVGMKAIDLKAKYVLPGLIDCHTHLATLPTARLALESGVTTARCAGVANYADVGLRELVRNGALAGPDISASGYQIRPDLMPEAFLSDPSLWPFMGTLSGPDAMRQVVRTFLSHGVDFIKVLATERAGTPETDPRKQTFTEAELRAIVEQAAASGIPVMAHAHGDEGARAAVRAGVRSIEHGTYLSDETLALMKQKKTFYVPTYGAWADGPNRNRARHMGPRTRTVVRRAHDMGIPIAAGSDGGYGATEFIRLSHEVVALVEIGLTPLEALQATTTVAAALLRIERTTGSLEAGLDADLIAVDGNPLEDPVVLEDVLFVVSNGRVALDRLRPARVD